MPLPALKVGLFSFYPEPMEIRDIRADMKAAYLDEYSAAVRSGNAERAAAVAKTLKDQFGHEVESKDDDDKPRRGRPPKARADEPKMPETAVEPKPAHQSSAK